MEKDNSNINEDSDFSLDVNKSENSDKNINNNNKVSEKNNNNNNSEITNKLDILDSNIQFLGNTIKE
jgi:hypothetical protein